jgi:hypothetical protein
VYIVSVYRTKNLRSVVYDKDFFDTLNEVLLSLSSERVILGGDFNARLGDLTGVLGSMDDARHLLPARAESSEADEAGAELLAVLLENNMARLVENDSVAARNTFQQWDGSGVSLIDYVFVSRPLLSGVNSYSVDFIEVANHAKLTVSVRLNATVPVQVPQAESGVGGRKIRLFNLEKLRSLEHTESIVKLATSTDGFTVQSALQTVIDFVGEYTEEIEVKPRSAPAVPADTLHAR